MSTPIPIRHSNGQRPTQPPVNGLSLTPARSPYPTSLRPSSFAALSLGRSTGRFSPYTTASASPYTPSAAVPAAPAPTPASAVAGPRLLSSGPRRNPFEQLSEGAFDDFVGSIQDRIKRALAGPAVESPSQRRKRREEEAQAQLQEKQADVFGEIKEVQAEANGDFHGESTSSPPHEPLPSPHRKPLFPPPFSASVSVVSRSPSHSDAGSRGRSGSAEDDDQSSNAFVASEDEVDEDDLTLGQQIERRNRQEGKELGYDARFARYESMYDEAEQEREFFERESSGEAQEEVEIGARRSTSAEEEDQLEEEDEEPTLRQSEEEEEELPPPFSSRPRSQPMGQPQEDDSEVLELSDSSESEEQDAEGSFDSQADHQSDSEVGDWVPTSLPPPSQIKPRPSSNSRPRSFEESPVRPTASSRDMDVDEEEEEEEEEDRSEAALSPDAAGEETESENLGSRIPYHLKGKGRALTPDTPSTTNAEMPSPTLSGVAEAVDSDDDSEWDDEALPSYSIGRLQAIMETIQGYIQTCIEEDEPEEIVELLEERLRVVEAEFEQRLVAMNVGGSGAAAMDAEDEAGSSGQESPVVSEDEEIPVPGMAQWSEMAPSGGEDMMVLYGDSNEDPDAEEEDEEVDRGHFDDEPPSQPDSPDRDQGSQAGEGEDELMISPSSPLPEYDDDGEEAAEDDYQDTSAFSPPRDEQEEQGEESLDAEEQLARQQIEAIAAQLVAMEESNRSGEVRVDEAFGTPLNGAGQLEHQEQVGIDYDAQEQSKMDYEAIFGGLEGMVQEQVNAEQFGLATDAPPEQGDDLVITSEYFNMPLDSPALPQHQSSASEQGDMIVQAETSVAAPPSPPRVSITEFLDPSLGVETSSFDFSLPQATETETLADLLAISHEGSNNRHSAPPQPIDLAPVDLTSSSPPAQSPEPERAETPPQAPLQELEQPREASTPPAIETERSHGTFTGIFSTAPTEPPIVTPTDEVAPVPSRGRRVAEGMRMARKPEGKGRSVFDEDEEENGEEPGDLLGVGDYGSGSDDEEEGHEQPKDMGEVVLSDSDEEEPSENKEQALLSEPMSYDSRDEEELEQHIEVDEQQDQPDDEAVLASSSTPPVASAASSPPPAERTWHISGSSPPRVRNVEEAGVWDPSTPIRFGPGSEAVEEAVEEVMEQVEKVVHEIEEAEDDAEMEIEVEMDVEVLEGVELTQPDEVTSVRGTSAIVEDPDHPTVVIITEEVEMESPSSPHEEAPASDGPSPGDASLARDEAIAATSDSPPVDEPAGETPTDDPPPVDHRSIIHEALIDTTTPLDSPPRSTTPSADPAAPLSPLLRPAILVPASEETEALIEAAAEEELARSTTPVDESTPAESAPDFEEELIVVESTEQPSESSLLSQADDSAMQESLDPAESTELDATTSATESVTSPALEENTPVAVPSEGDDYASESSEDEDADLIVASTLLSSRDSPAVAQNSPELDEPALDNPLLSPSTPREDPAGEDTRLVGTPLADDPFPIDDAQVEETVEEQDLTLTPAEDETLAELDNELREQEGQEEQSEVPVSPQDDRPSQGAVSDPDSGSEDELMLVIPRTTTGAKKSPLPGRIAAPSPRRTSSRLRTEPPQETPVTAEPESSSQPRRSTRSRSTVAESQEVPREAEVEVSEPSRRTTRSTTATVNVEEDSTPVTPKGKGKRSRVSDPTPSSPPSTPKRRRGQESPAIEVPVLDARPLPRRHDHSHASFRVEPSAAPTAHLPVTRSHCELHALEFKSKLVATPFLVAIPSCALATQLAQDTIAEFDIIDRGPVEQDSGGTPLGGAGLVDGPAANDERDVELFQGDEDVLAAVRRVAGVELYDEGACELLPPPKGMSLRSPRKRGVEEEAGSRKRRA